jgi:branched-chain amino acid transport system ATP-binding protein
MLELRDLHVSHRKVRAVSGLDLRVRQGETVAIIGANGAGKSSTLHAICGVVRPVSGRILFMDEDITGLASHKVISRGISCVPEGRMIIGGLSVRENLMLGGFPRRRSTREVARELQAVLSVFPILAERLDEPGANLSGGQAQMLALARGLMASPKLLMLDEPSLGLAPAAARDVFRLIVDLRSRGVTILLVEQNVRRALQVADRVYLLEHGRATMAGSARELLTNERLIRSYLGIEEDKGEAA